MQKYDRRRLPSSIATYSVENGLSCMKIILKKFLEESGFEPEAFRMRSEHSTTELHPHFFCYYFLIQ